MWNRITAFMVLVTTASLLFTSIEVEARGGRGGGGRSSGARGGGSYSGGRAMNRTPTMSRAVNRPAAPALQQIQSTPAVSQGRVQQSRQVLQQRPSTANRAELRSQVNQYAQNRPTQNIDHQALAQRSQNFSRMRSNQIAQDRQLSDRVSQRLQQARPDSRQWFDRNFFDSHNLAGDYLRTGTNLWRPATWAALATWGAWNWSTPYYYDDGGYAYPITNAESTYVYSGGGATTTPYQQPAQGAQVVSTAGGEWLPLGVFAVVSNANTAAQSNRFIQLAVNRSGEIGGVLYNSLTDAAQDLIGTVNTTTQMAYWSLDNRPGAPVASTGIYNLTGDQTPVNVHFSDGSDQTWTLVRLQLK